MIQYHKVADLEVAISLGVLIPADAPPRSRHRFWVSDIRLDAFKNRDGVIFLHWVQRTPGDKAAKEGVRACNHPQPDGFHHAIISPGSTSYYYYRNPDYPNSSGSGRRLRWQTHFTMCAKTGRGEE